MDTIKELLANECGHRFSMDEPVMEKFIGAMEEIGLPRGGILTHYGQLDTNLYIIKSGILKLTYLEGDKETILAFGMDGSLLTQMHCYYIKRPSFFQCEACTDAVVLKISKLEFDSLVNESAYFARWALDRAIDQLCGLELRLERVNGPARERYLSMLRLMPEVAIRVKNKDIASYLGITPIYLSRLKKELGIPRNSGTEEKPLFVRSSKTLSNDSH